MTPSETITKSINKLREIENQEIPESHEEINEKDSEAFEVWLTAFKELTEEIPQFITQPSQDLTNRMIAEMQGSIGKAKEGFKTV